MKIIAITQARFGSTRLPGKVLKKVQGKSLLQIHLERASKAKKIDELIVATTLEKESYEICSIAQKLGLKFYQGSTNDVLDRFYQTVIPEKPDYVVRITSDCPLIDGRLIDEVVNKAIETDAEYCSNVYPPTFPDGFDVEVFKFSALEDAWMHAKLPSEREHVTVYIHEKSERNNRCSNFSNDVDYSHYRVTVDTLADFELIEKIISKIGDDKS